MYYDVVAQDSTLTTTLNDVIDGNASLSTFLGEVDPYLAALGPSLNASGPLGDAR